MDVGYHHSTYHRESGGLWESVADRARRLEADGFSLVGFMDHLWQLPQLGRQDEAILDCHTALSATAAVTDSVDLSALVTCVHYRNPALLGRLLTSLDSVSEGRAVLGIGAGWFDAEYDAYGYEFPDPETRVRQLEDAIRLIRAMWTEDSPVTYRGDFYEIEDLVLEPKPLRDPHPPILVGGGGEQLTLRVTAKHADWWNVPGRSPGEYAHKLDVLREHCEAVGREYDEIRKTTIDTVVVRDTTEAAHEAYEALMAETEGGPTPRGEGRGAVGTPAEVAERVESFADLGVDLYILEPPLNDPETIDRFVDDVMPAID